MEQSFREKEIGLYGKKLFEIGGCISQPNLWCLYSKSRDEVVQGLRLDEVRAFVTATAPSELLDWLIWQEGWDLWKNVTEVDEVMEPISRTVRGPVPEAPITRTETMTDSVILAKQQPMVESNGFKDITVSSFGMDSDLDVEVFETKTQGSGILSRFVKRNFTRYKKQLKIEILGKDGQTFTSFSKDISVGGILLSEPLPHWVAGYSQVKIVDRERKQAIEVTCSVVEDQDPNYRVRLEILPLQKKEEEIHFDSWLAA